jgi:hypothetical protein
MEALVVMPAVSLANAVLNTLLSWAVPAMADKAALVLGVQKHVQYIHDELTMMNAFLRASSPAAGDVVQAAWVKNLRDIAFDIEDGLLDFMLLKGPSADLLRVAERIGSIRDRVKDLHERNHWYQAFVRADRSPRHDHHADADDDSEPTLLDDWRHQPIIGRDGDKKALARLLRRDGATVVAVWGMAGVGKSSLARMLYNDSDLFGRFDRRAWVTVLHPLEGAEEFTRLLQEQIGVDGYERCLVVVDDVSSHEEWEHITRCLAANDAGGRIVVLVTTHQEHVARRCARDDDVYELKPLPHKEACKLLCQKVRPRPSSLSN